MREGLYESTPRFKSFFRRCYGNLFAKLQSLAQTLLEELHAKLIIIILDTFGQSTHTNHTQPALKQKLIIFSALICTSVRKSPEMIKQELSVINIFWRIYISLYCRFHFPLIRVFSSICKPALNFSISKPTIFFRFV